MREIEIPDPATSIDAARAWLHAFASAHGIQIVSEGSLKTLPGSRHWHLRKPSHAGTLEATYSPKTGRFWFKVAANRDADWIGEILRQAPGLVT